MMLKSNGKWSTAVDLQRREPLVGLSGGRLAP
jgi:hypothetical protein